MQGLQGDSKDTDRGSCTDSPVQCLAYLDGKLVDLCRPGDEITLTPRFKKAALPITPLARTTAGGFHYTIFLVC